jgi:hypothetical protein
MHALDNCTVRSDLIRQEPVSEAEIRLVLSALDDMLSDLFKPSQE